MSESENNYDVPREEPVQDIPERGDKDNTLWGKADSSWRSTPKQKKLLILYIMIFGFGCIFLFEVYRILQILNVF